MALVRGLTKRMGRAQRDEEIKQNQAPARAFSNRRFALTAQSFDRNKISLPLELLSSSNALAYEAPDIHGSKRIQSINIAPSPSSSASSTNSYQESMGSPGLSSASSVTSHEASQESSPVTIEPNHLTSFFLEKDPTSNRSKSIREPSRTQHPQPSNPSPPSHVTQQPNVSQPAVSAPADKDVPGVPQRALSHTKRTHQALARQRSKTRPIGPPSLPPSGPGTRSSVDMFSHKPEADHPFGAELQQVNELAEEFGMGNVEILDEESQYLIDHGFQRFSAADYIDEIKPLLVGCFGEYPAPAPVTWL